MKFEFNYTNIFNVSTLQEARADFTLDRLAKHIVRLKNSYDCAEFLHDAFVNFDDMELRVYIDIDLDYFHGFSRPAEEKALYMQTTLKELYQLIQTEIYSFFAKEYSQEFTMGDSCSPVNNFPIDFKHLDMCFEDYFYCPSDDKQSQRKEADSILEMLRNR